MSRISNLINKYFMLESKNVLNQNIIDAIENLNIGKVNKIIGVSNRKGDALDYIDGIPYNRATRITNILLITDLNVKLNIEKEFIINTVDGKLQSFNHSFYIYDSENHLIYNSNKDCSLVKKRG